MRIPWRKKTLSDIEYRAWRSLVLKAAMSTIDELPGDGYRVGFSHAPDIKRFTVSAWHEDAPEGTPSYGLMIVAHTQPPTYAGLEGTVYTARSFETGAPNAAEVRFQVHSWNELVRFVREQMPIV